MTGKKNTCEVCNAMKTEISQLKGKVTRLKNKLATNQQQWVETFKELQEQNRLCMVNTGKIAVMLDTMNNVTMITALMCQPTVTMA